MIAVLAREVMDRCRVLAACTDAPGTTTRTFLSPAVHDVHGYVRAWMEAADMTVSVDAAGNIRGLYPGGPAAPAPTTAAPAPAARPRLLLGSHLDTVPRAGAYDGVLGVVLGIALVAGLEGRRLPYAIEVIGFSEEEGVRFGTPFLGSLALVGGLDDTLLAQRDADGCSVADAIRRFGLDPARLPDARVSGTAFAYVEVHIEQGPVLDGLGRPLGVVEAIAGQTRATVTFVGAASHAGTTPMAARRDAVAGAAEWILAVEGEARSVGGLVATVGRVTPRPGAGNVVAGECDASLDVRHGTDAVRRRAVDRLLDGARAIAARRGLDVRVASHLDQPATPMDASLTAMLAIAAGPDAPRLTSGAGHDAMVMARRLPCAMLFLRSPGGVGHHPDETVHEADVAAALAAGARLLDQLAESRTWPA